MPRLVWTRPALEDVQEIHAYIARDSPLFARLVAERLFSAVFRLREHPLSGRMIPELGEPALREVIERPYRLLYRVRSEVVEVLPVVHSARRFPIGDLRD